MRELNECVQRIYDEMAEMLLREPTYAEPNGVSVRLVLENSITSRMLRRGDSMASDLGGASTARREADSGLAR